MFQVLVIKKNVFDDFKQSLWQEKEKVKKFIEVVTTDNLQQSLNSVFNPDYSREKMDLNTMDVLYTKGYTYQLVYDSESENENYIASVINYKRKPIKGTCVLVKIRITDNDNKLEYKEAEMDINHDIDFIIKDLFYHIGYKITNTIEEFEFDNKYNILVDDNKMKELNSYEINLFGIPFRIWYKESATKDKSLNVLSYVKDIGIFLNKNITEVYITCSVYPQCKCMSLNRDILKQFIDLITTFPDEGELKEITVAYSFATKNNRSENVYILFSDFYWKVMSSEK
jgi:hypothetical protein